MENKNKIIIIVLIAVIAALLVGIVAVMPNTAKQDTNLTFKSKSSLTEGDSLKVKLTDANGTALANQTVNITITDKDGASDYHSVVTNENGTGKLKLDKSAGKYNVTISYAGNDKYNPSNATKKITVEEEVVEVQSTQEVSSTSSSGTGSSGGSGESVEVDYVDDGNGFTYGSKGGRKGFWTPTGNFFEE